MTKLLNFENEKNGYFKHFFNICVNNVNSGKKFIWVQTSHSFKFVLLFVGYICLQITHWYHILRMQYRTEIRLFNRPCFILVLNRVHSYIFFFISTTYSNFAFLEGSEQACRKKSLKMLGIFQQDYLKFNGTTWMWKALPTSRSFAFVCFLLLQTSAIKKDIWIGVLLMHGWNILSSLNMYCNFNQWEK